MTQVQAVSSAHWPQNEHPTAFQDGFILMQMKCPRTKQGRGSVMVPWYVEDTRYFHSQVYMIGEYMTEAYNHGTTLLI